MDLICPKCQGPMRSYERNGVTVDQCAECRGIFLDRGELERLVDAESAWQGRDAQPAPRASAPQQSYREQQPYRDERPYSGQQPGYGRPHKKRKSFLEELFD